MQASSSPQGPIDEIARAEGIPERRPRSALPAPRAQDAGPPRQRRLALPAEAAVASAREPRASRGDPRRARARDRRVFRLVDRVRLRVGVPPARARIFMNGFFLDSVVDMAPYFRTLPFLLTLFIPAITMRSWAEERASGTFELVMTLPLRPIAIVLGKYFAALLFYLAVLSGSLPIVIMLFCAREARPRPPRRLVSRRRRSSARSCSRSGSSSRASRASRSSRSSPASSSARSSSSRATRRSSRSSTASSPNGRRGRGWPRRSRSSPTTSRSAAASSRSPDVFYFVVTSAFFLVMNEITLRLASRAP